MDFTKDTMVKDILAAYPDIKQKLIAAEPKFKALDNPLVSMMLQKATIADVSDKIGMSPEDVITQLKALIAQK